MTDWKRKPDFFIVGAPKCGTTALHFYLREHPDIFLPDRKELHYFGSDMAFHHDRSEATYQSAFDDWGSEKRGGEASVWYLHSQRAAREIQAFQPQARIIVMLRNPADMVHAQHAQAMYVGRETIVDFDEALDAEAGRVAGTIPTHPLSPPEVFRYSQIARYTEQLQRYHETFGADQVHVILFDDLKTQVKQVYADTLGFLDVDTSYEADLRPRNQNRRFRNRQLHYLVNNPNPTMRSLAKSLLPIGLLRQAKRYLSRWNTSRAPRDRMNPSTRQRLNELYADEVRQLSDYLNRDLTHWSKTPAAPSTRSQA